MALKADDNVLQGLTLSATANPASAVSSSEILITVALTNNTAQARDMPLMAGGLWNTKLLVFDADGKRVYPNSPFAGSGRDVTERVVFLQPNESIRVTMSLLQFGYKLTSGSYNLQCAHVIRARNVPAIFAEPISVNIIGKPQ